MNRKKGAVVALGTGWVSFVYACVLSGDAQNEQSNAVDLSAPRIAAPAITPNDDLSSSGQREWSPTGAQALTRWAMMAALLSGGAVLNAMSFASAIAFWLS